MVKWPIVLDIRIQHSRKSYVERGLRFNRPGFCISFTLPSGQNVDVALVNDDDQSVQISGISGANKERWELFAPGYRSGWVKMNRERGYYRRGVRRTGKSWSCAVRQR